MPGVNYKRRKWTMKVKLQDNHCDVCGTGVVHNTIEIELKNGSHFEVCPQCLIRAKEMLQPYDFYDVIGGNE